MIATAKVHNLKNITVTESLRARLDAKVNRGEPDQCWPWAGAERSGYGAIKHEKKVYGSHVVAYVIANGPVPEGKIIMHSCDNKKCCNPNHLKAGTTSENVRDSYKRLPVNLLHGIKAPNAVLNDDIVRQILELRREKKYGATRISKLLGLSLHRVRYVIYDGGWSHVANEVKESAQ